MKVAINGFGRIGRTFFRQALKHGQFEIVAINDLADASTLAHLLKYDSVHGRFDGTITVENDALIINENKILLTKESNPQRLPWATTGVDIVVESTGFFRDIQSANQHIIAGATKVIISAPAKSPEIPTVVLGINESEIDFSSTVISNASCTTNSVAPLVAVMQSLATISSAYITTVHSYTGDQKLHDAPHSDLRRGRAAAESIVPTTTGAAKAITKIYPELDGKIGGAGIRVPVPNGSLTDMTFIVDKRLTVEAINTAFRAASQSYLKGILEYTEDPIVSRDIIGSTYSSVFDAQLTSVIDNMVKVVGWYDNEMGYSTRLVELVNKLSK